MKKNNIIAITIALLATTISGCDFFKQMTTPKEVAPVYIDSWLSSVRSPAEDPNGGEFSVKGEDGNLHSNYDYGLKVCDLMKDIDYGQATKLGNEKHTETEKYFTYIIRAYVGDLSYCYISVYSDGAVITTAYGTAHKLSPGIEPQYFEYNLDTTVVNNLIDNVFERYNEIKEGIAHEREDALENMSFDKFVAAIEESETIPTIDYRETRGEAYGTTTFTVSDVERGVYNLIKDVELTKKEDSYITSVLPMVSYYIDANWKFQIYYDGWGDARYDVTSIDCIYDSEFKSYYSSHYVFYFSIDAAKGEAIADAVRALH